MAAGSTTVRNRETSGWKPLAVAGSQTGPSAEVSRVRSVAAGEGVSYVGMSIAVSGGLTVCTVFTTIVVPVVYLFLDDVQNWFLGAMRKAFDDLAVIAQKTGETIEPSGS